MTPKEFLIVELLIVTQIVFMMWLVGSRIPFTPLVYGNRETEQYIQSLAANVVDTKCPSLVRNAQDFDVLTRQVIFHNSLWRGRYTWKKPRHRAIIRELEAFNQYEWHKDYEEE